MKNILIATDFSSHSHHTIQCMMDFVQETQIPYRVILLNTYLVPIDTPQDKLIEENDKLSEESQRKLDQDKILAINLLKKHSAHQVETVSSIGSLPNVILKLAHNEKVDLVAMGKDGGSHIQKVSHRLKKHHGTTLFVTYL